MESGVGFLGTRRVVTTRGPAELTDFFSIIVMKATQENYEI